MNINIYLSDVKARLEAILRGGPGVVAKDEAEHALWSLEKVMQSVQTQQASALAYEAQRSTTTASARVRMASCADLLEQAISLSADYISDTADKAVPEEPIRQVVARLRDPFITE